jgi:hypothetical protein
LRWRGVGATIKVKILRKMKVLMQTIMKVKVPMKVKVLKKMNCWWRWSKGDDEGSGSEGAEEGEVLMKVK